MDYRKKYLKEKFPYIWGVYIMDEGVEDDNGYILGEGRIDIYGAFDCPTMDRREICLGRGIPGSIDVGIKSMFWCFKRFISMEDVKEVRKLSVDILDEIRNKIYKWIDSDEKYKSRDEPICNLKNNSLEYYIEGYYHSDNINVNVYHMIYNENIMYSKIVILNIMDVSTVYNLENILKSIRCVDKNTSSAYILYKILKEMKIESIKQIDDEKFTFEVGTRINQNIKYKYFFKENCDVEYINDYSYSIKKNGVLELYNLMQQIDILVKKLEEKYPEIYKSIKEELELKKYNNSGEDIFIIVKGLYSINSDFIEASYSIKFNTKGEDECRTMISIYDYKNKSFKDIILELVNNLEIITINSNYLSKVINIFGCCEIISVFVSKNNNDFTVKCRSSLRSNLDYYDYFKNNNDNQIKIIKDNEIYFSHNFTVNKLSSLYRYKRTKETGKNIKEIGNSTIKGISTVFGIFKDLLN